MISLIGLMFGLLITLMLEFFLKTNKKLRRRYYWHHNIFLGYHTHHSIYGLFFILFGIIFYFIKDIPASIFSISAGFGVIIVHTISDGRFIFWEKQIKKLKK